MQAIVEKLIDGVLQPVSVSCFQKEWGFLRLYQTATFSALATPKILLRKLLVEPLAAVFVLHTLGAHLGRVLRESSESLRSFSACGVYPDGRH